jgi:hypothetical protein
MKTQNRIKMYIQSSIRNETQTIFANFVTRVHNRGNSFYLNASNVSQNVIFYAPTSMVAELKFLIGRTVSTCHWSFHAALNIPMTSKSLHSKQLNYLQAGDIVSTMKNSHSNIH